MTTRIEERIEALEQAFMVWTLMEKRMLSALISQLMIDVPEFKAENLVTRLHDLQEAMNPNTEDAAFNSEVRLGLRFLGEFVELVEDSITQSRRGPRA